MRVGWKVHRLTTKELCHSNETLHALNSTFSDTNCIVSFQINSHWISNSGVWKVLLETFWKQPGKLTKGVLFHQDTAPAHESVVTMAAVCQCGLELDDQPPYSPDLSPYDYFLFPNMKKHLAGKQYRTDDKVISAVEDFFEDQAESFYTVGIQALQPRWKKGVDHMGRLWWKINHIWSNSIIAS